MAFTHGKEYNLLIVTYETMRLRAAILPKLSCNVLVCDEGHRLRNQNGQLREALSEVPCRHRILLSGTPMPNNVRELTSLVTFVTGLDAVPQDDEVFKALVRDVLLRREVATLGGGLNIPMCSIYFVRCQAHSEAEEVVISLHEVARVRRECKVKLDVVEALLAVLPSMDRIVIASYSVHVLDLVSELCHRHHWPFLRIDGATSSTKRAECVR